MSRFVTHIYRMEMGKGGKAECATWLYARNAKEAKEYCKLVFKDKRYDFFRAIMVGETKAPVANAPCLLSDFEMNQITSTIAKDGEHYAEHRWGVPGV